MIIVVTIKLVIVIVIVIVIISHNTNSNSNNTSRRRSLPDRVMGREMMRLVGMQEARAAKRNRAIR